MARSSARGLIMHCMKLGRKNNFGATTVSALAKNAAKTALGLALVGCCAMPALSWAETIEGAGGSITAESTPQLPAALKGDTPIEQLTNNYHAAVAQVSEAQARVAELQVQIDALEAVLPAQQARSDAGIRQRYVMQSNPLAIVESLLEAETFGDFIRQTEYLERITEANLEEFNRTTEMKHNLDAAKAEQVQVQEAAEQKESEAKAALRAEQDARAAKQREAIEAAGGQASTQGGEASVGKAAPGAEPQDEGYKEAANPDTDPLNDGADWYADRDEFIAEWAPRIDAYLAGTPTEGQGVNYAATAWKYCIDPRWSPAISNTESSKGRVCIRPHNAWGWGAADSNPYGLASEWDSWETAIEAHIRGLEKGYGYTISMGGAQKYCPYTWQSWYNNTLNEMAKI